MSQLSAARAATGLLDRDAQLARLGALLEDGRAGRGGLVVVEGPPGIGKSRLLAAARAMAAGFTVLTARAGELERDFPWGVVRQLFESTVLLVESAERAELLAGAAATAAEPLGLGGARGRIETYAALHGLYWLAVNLATRDPLLLCVDDVQWADPPSVRFLQHLVTRIEDLPLLVVAAQRAHPAHPAVDLAADLPPDDVIRLDPLSDTAVAALVTDRLGPAEPGFLRACHHATGGNPFLVGELVAGLHRRGVAPRDHDIAEVTELGPHSVARAVLRRVQRLSPDAAALARAVAVLGTDVALRHAASLAELEPLAALAAADALAAVDVLRPGEPFDFVHPMVRSAVRDAIPAGARAGLHLHAAGLLRSDRAAPGRERVDAGRGVAAGSGAGPRPRSRRVDRGGPREAARQGVGVQPTDADQIGQCQPGQPGRRHRLPAPRAGRAARANGPRERASAAGPRCPARRRPHGGRALPGGPVGDRRAGRAGRDGARARRAAGARR